MELINNFLDALDKMSPEERMALAAKLNEEAQRHETAAEVVPEKYKALCERAYNLRRFAQMVDPPAD